MSIDRTTPIEEVEFSVRVANCFAHFDVKTFHDLVRLSETELMRWPNFGKTSLNEVKETLWRAGGFTLRPELPKAAPVEMKRPLSRYEKQQEVIHHQQQELKRLNTMFDLLADSQAALKHDIRLLQNSMLKRKFGEAQRAE